MYHIYKRLQCKFVWVILYNSSYWMLLPHILPMLLLRTIFYRAICAVIDQKDGQLRADETYKIMSLWELGKVRDFSMYECICCVCDIVPSPLHRVVLACAFHAKANPIISWINYSSTLVLSIMLFASWSISTLGWMSSRFLRSSPRYNCWPTPWKWCGLVSIAMPTFLVRVVLHQNLFLRQCGAHVPCMHKVRRR